MVVTYNHHLSSYKKLRKRQKSVGSTMLPFSKIVWSGLIGDQRLIVVLDFDSTRFSQNFVVKLTYINLFILPFLGHLLVLVY